MLSPPFLMGTVSVKKSSARSIKANALVVTTPSNKINQKRLSSPRREYTNSLFQTVLKRKRRKNLRIMRATRKWPLTSGRKSLLRPKCVTICRNMATVITATTATLRTRKKNYKETAPSRLIIKRSSATISVSKASVITAQAAASFTAISIARSHFLTREVFASKPAWRLSALMRASAMVLRPKINA